MINLIIKHFLIFFESFLTFLGSFSPFKFIIFFSDKERTFNNILIIADIMEEYNI